MLAALVTTALRAERVPQPSDAALGHSLRPALEKAGDLEVVHRGWALRAGSATPAEFAARLATATRGTEDDSLEAAQ